MNIKRRGGNVGLKLDISQAYDTISWDFLVAILKKYGFSERFTNWITVLLKTTKISIILNGGPIGYFGVGRGVKQVDPLSPLLYVLVADTLSRNLTQLIQERKIQPMVIRKGIYPSYLFFADDIFIFCNGCKQSLVNLKHLLVEYQRASGQLVSASNSKFFIDGTSNIRQNQIAKYMNMELFVFPDKYLGVVLVQGKVKIEHLWSFVEMLQKRLATWIEKKYITIAWDKICAPLEKGGLGIIKFEDINKALLMKLLSRILKSNEDWAKILLAKYKDKNGHWISYYKQSSVWPGIKWILREFEENTRCLVGNGENISVWNDSWILDASINKYFPENEYIQQNIHTKVKHLIVNNTWTIPEDMLLFFSTEDLSILTNTTDKLVWTSTQDGEFYVSSAINLIRKKQPKLKWYKKIWNSCVHPSTRGAANTNENTSKRGSIFAFKNPKSFDEVVNLCKNKSSVIQELWMVYDYEIRLKGFMNNTRYDLQILKYFDIGCRKVKFSKAIEFSFFLPEPENFLFCCDGASRRNPGNAGYGFIVMDNIGRFISAKSGGLGISTNFIAEIMGTLCAMEWVVKNHKEKITINSDSTAAISSYMKNKLPWFIWNR
ncbi:uncharacterized protein LOC113360377 [Papaver somniferum]|uniref:uncharacterized protein LOC113360377 n=1 Tax=Papaver somniferum TaxID=3469 RepID=UPI000E6F50B2|nr:uncharacterized protein LOC113360377 [Papaver somniferum]